MKKLLLAVCCICLLSACEKPKGEAVDTGNGYKERTIDGCEYIECDYGILDQRVYSLTHKGNCKNTIHGKGYFYPSKIITCKKCGAEMVETGERLQ